MTITGQSVNTIFPLGETAELLCAFKGTPSPRVQWYFKGRPVSNRNVMTTPSGARENGNTTLTINNLQVKDIGYYQCVLSNFLNSVHHGFDICGTSE